MARLRYVKTLEQVKQSAESNPEFLNSTVHSIRVVYETDPAIVAAVIPQPLKPTDRPEVCVTFSQVAIHLSPELTIEIGSTIFGVRAFYDGVEGIYLVTMPSVSRRASSQCHREAVRSVCQTQCAARTCQVAARNPSPASLQ